MKFFPEVRAFELRPLQWTKWQRNGVEVSLQSEVESHTSSKRFLKHHDPARVLKNEGRRPIDRSVERPDWYEQSFQGAETWQGISKGGPSYLVGG